MNFIQISNNVEQFLEKQKKGMLSNPRNINLTLKRLDLYVTSFHTEINDLLKLENMPINVDIEKRVKKPSFDQLDTDEFEQADKIKRKMQSLSNKLMNELMDFRRNSNGGLLDVIFYNRAEDEFKRNVHKMLKKELDFPFKGTVLGQIISGIEREVFTNSFEINHRRVERLFQEIKSERVINELKNNVEGKLSVLVNNFIRSYTDYFNECIRYYETHSRGEGVLISSKESPVRSEVNEVSSVILDKQENVITDENEKINCFNETIKQPVVKSEENNVVTSNNMSDTEVKQMPVGNVLIKNQEVNAQTNDSVRVILTNTTTIEAITFTLPNGETQTFSLKSLTYEEMKSVHRLYNMLKQINTV